MESENVSLRTKSALQQAKKNGVVLGKKRIDEEIEQKILSMYLSGDYTLEEISYHCDVCIKTIYNVRKRNDLLTRN